MAPLVDHTGRPKYIEVAASLRSAISAGTYPVGSELPSTARLTQSFGVSTTVVRAAIRELRDDGLVVGQPGKAVFVRALPGEVAHPDDVGQRLEELGAFVRSELAEIRARVAALEAER